MLISKTVNNDVNRDSFFFHYAKLGKSSNLTVKSELQELLL